VVFCYNFTKDKRMQEKSNLVIYRLNEKGLEVFMVKKDEDAWDFPEGTAEQVKTVAVGQDERFIALEPLEEEGIFEQAYAVEADWHDIPSLKSILFHDLLFVKDTVKKMIPDMMERGTFVAVKDALKRVMPNKYKLLKELKEIITDRNSTKYM